ncbi:putative adhesion G protein-coupled receptor E4P isoform X1 [Tachypleus tridentatus]|uniref:putative adhesion G protein-coupled receptor E4P isoform X1 n=2 Tax=Tachypleus tridentatus TaxID=6853 RepID=UPI003FD20655
MPRTSFFIPTLLFVLFCILIIDAQNPVNGGWTEWSIVSSVPCSKHCGGGKAERVRTCTNPVPQFGGDNCTGPETKIIDCNTHTCDEEILSSNWLDWSECSEQCTVGLRTRVRECYNETSNDGFSCVNRPDLAKETQNCTAWSLKKSFNYTGCPSPCDQNSDLYTSPPLNIKHCPNRAKCDDTSDATGPSRICTCVMGYLLDKDDWACLPRPPPSSTPRPTPTMSPVEKTVAIVLTRTASTILLVMTGLTIVLFLLLRIFTVDRVIQMNMELAIFLAHIMLIFPADTCTTNKELCRILSICLHFFFTACFTFLLLEALHMYSMVAYVVPKNGMLSRAQNIIIGWGVPALVSVASISFFLEDYGGEYHCWLQMDKPLVYLQYGPVCCICLLNIILLEAAGASDYKPLKAYDSRQLFSARIHQRSNLILMPLILSSWILGMLSDYEQNIGLYSTFAIINAIIGFAIFILHSLGNQEVREKVKQLFHCCFSKVK